MNPKPMDKRIIFRKFWSDLYSSLGNKKEKINYRNDGIVIMCLAKRGKRGNPIILGHVISGNW